MVGNMYVGRILMGLASQEATKAPEVELEPMQPGAWAAWAKAATKPATKASSPIAVKGTLVGAKG